MTAAKNLLVNLERTNESLEKFDLDAIISSSRENTTYLTNFLSVSRIQDRLYNISAGSGENYLRVYGILPRNGRPVLILPLALYMIAQLDGTVDDDRIFSYGRTLSIRESEAMHESQLEDKFERYLGGSGKIFETPALALSAAVKEFVGGSSCGVDFSDMDPSSLNALKSQGIKTKNATELLRIIRLVKSPEEIQRLERSAKVNELGIESMLSSMREGARETDIVSAYAKTIVSEGARFDLGNVLFGSGPRSGEMVSPSPRMMKQGDVIWFDVICSLNGYSADTGESACIGKPSSKHLNIYNAMRAVVEKAEEVILPGMKPSEICKASEVVWSNFNLPKPPVTLGHGIGIETHEYPQLLNWTASRSSTFIRDDFISSSPDIPIEEGMVLNLESAYLIRGWGGVHLERTVIVEKNKCRPIADQDRNLRIFSSQ